MQSVVNAYHSASRRSRQRLLTGSLIGRSRPFTVMHIPNFILKIWSISESHGIARDRAGLFTRPVGLIHPQAITEH